MLISTLLEGKPHNLRAVACRSLTAPPFLLGLRLSGCCGLRTGPLATGSVELSQTLVKGFRGTCPHLLFYLPFSGSLGKDFPTRGRPCVFVCIKGFSFLSVLSLFRFCSAWFALELGIPSPALIFQKYVGPSTQKMFTGKDCKILQRQEWGGFSEL